MTTGEAYRGIVKMVREGNPISIVAEKYGCKPTYVRRVLALYKQQGEKLFERRGRFRAKNKDCPGADYWEIYYEECKKQERMGAESMEKLRSSLKIGDTVTFARYDGVGNSPATRRWIKITIDYIGRSFVGGTTPKGIRETVNIHELWKEGRVERNGRVWHEGKGKM